MIRHIWKIIWNERRHNIGLLIELILVAIATWYITDELYVQLSNYYKPLNFDTEHTYKLSLGRLSESSSEFVEPILTDREAMMEEELGHLHKLLERINANSMVEAASISINSTPHIGSNSYYQLFRDTLQSSYYVLLRRVTPDFFKVFRYQTPEGSTEELVDALKRGEIVISQGIKDDLFPDESPLGKYISQTPDEPNQMKVGAVSTIIRYDNFSNSEDYFAVPLASQMQTLLSFVFSYPYLIEWAVRVKPEEDYDFATRFREQMTDQLRVGNYFLSDISYIPDDKEMFQRDNKNDLKTKGVVMGFLLLNIFLGVTGVFWFRTQKRKGEVGLRISQGDTPKGILGKFYLEGLLLLLIALVPAMIAFYFIGDQGLLNSWFMKLSIERYLIGFGITFVLLALMIFLGVTFPAKKVAEISPAEALRDE